MNYIISQEDLQLVLAYIGKQPYIEVAKLINILGSLKQLPADSKKKDESAKKIQ